MPTIVTNTGLYQVTDDELGPQIDWVALRATLLAKGMTLQYFCGDARIPIADFHRFVKGTHRATARIRLRVAFQIAAMHLDPEHHIVRSGRTPEDFHRVTTKAG